MVSSWLAFQPNNPVRVFRACIITNSTLFFFFPADNDRPYIDPLALSFNQDALTLFFFQFPRA